jgi:hypothetical protein
MTVLTYNTRFCPSWAEAHERSLASLNHGRPPYPVKWKGCIVVRRGTCVDVVEQQEQSTEIVIRGKHWITDEMPDVIPGRACPTTSARQGVTARCSILCRLRAFVRQSLFRPNPNPN